MTVFLLFYIYIWYFCFPWDLNMFFFDNKRDSKWIINHRLMYLSQKKYIKFNAFCVFSINKFEFSLFFCGCSMFIQKQSINSNKFYLLSSATSVYRGGGQFYHVIWKHKKTTKLITSLNIVHIEWLSSLLRIILVCCYTWLHCS